MTDDDIAKLERLGTMLERGLLSREEYDAQKVAILTRSSRSGTASSVPAAEMPPPAVDVFASPMTVEPPPAGRPPIPAPRYWTAGRIGLALVAIPATFLVAVVVGGNLLGVGGGAGGGAGGLLASPRFSVANVEVNDSCAKLTDYCIRVSCHVTNEGTADGVAQVSLDLAPVGKVKSSAIESAFIPHGATRTVTHDFVEAKLLDDNRGGCFVMQ